MNDTIQYRNPVKAVGHAQLYHMATMDPRISDGAYRLFALYLMYAQQKGLCWPGRDRLAAELDITPVTVSRRNQELIDAGYITREPRPGRKSSWMTYIEDVENIPFLQEKAKAILGERQENEVSKMIPNRSDEVSEMIPKKEQEVEKEQDMGAYAPTHSASLPDGNGIYTAVLVVEEDPYVLCPACSEQVDWNRQPTSGGTCPHCQVGLRIEDSHGNIKKKGKRSKLTLGSLFEDMPDNLRHVNILPQQVNDLRAVYDVDPTYIWEALRWAAGLVADGKMPVGVLVTRALSWAKKRVDAFTASGEGDDIPSVADAMGIW